MFSGRIAPREPSKTTSPRLSRWRCGPTVRAGRVSGLSPASMERTLDRRLDGTAMIDTDPRRRRHMATRTGSATWKGDQQGGEGNLTVGDGVFEGAYTFKSRFEE